MSKEATEPVVGDASTLSRMAGIEAESTSKVGVAMAARCTVLSKACLLGAAEPADAGAGGDAEHVFSSATIRAILSVPHV